MNLRRKTRICLVPAVVLCIAAPVVADTPLRQGTAVTVQLGPFFDPPSDFQSATSLTISQSDIRVSKNGGSFTQSNHTSGATHTENGYYSLTLDENDTDTLGRLRVAVSKNAGVNRAWQDFIVYPPEIFDAMVTGTELIPANVTQFGGVDGTFSDGRPEVIASDASIQAIIAANPLLVLEGEIEDVASTSSLNVSHASPAMSSDLSGAIVIIEHAEVNGGGKSWRRLESLEVGDPDTVITVDPRLPLQTEQGDKVYVLATPPQLETIAAIKQDAAAIAGGYNKVLQVKFEASSGVNLGPAYYPTITAAQADASAGDLIVIHPGEYDDIAIGKEGVTYYLAYGVTLDGSSATEHEALFSGSVSFRVLGHGKITHSDPTSYFIWPTPSNVVISIECDEIDASNLNGPYAPITMSAGQLTIRAKCIVGPDDGVLVNCFDGHVDVAATHLENISTVASVANPDAHVAIRASRLHNPSAAGLISGSAGTVLIDGVIHSTHADSNGLNAPSGVTVIAKAGGIKVPNGRPSLSGSGTILVSDAFAYDASTATAGNIIATPTEAMFAKLPSKDYLAGTNNSTGDVELGDATGEATANVVKWAGATTGTGDLAMKSVLAKGTDITGFNDPTAAETATAVRTELATELARLDASITSRHPAGAAVASVIGDVEGNILGSVASVVDKEGFSLAADQSAVTIGTVNTLVDHTPQSGDSFSIVSDALIGNSAIRAALETKASQASVDDLPTLAYFEALFDGAPTFGEAMDAQGYTTVRAAKLDNLDMPTSEIAASMPSLLISTTIDTLASQTSFTLAAGPPDDNALNGALVVITSASDGTQKAVGLVREYVGASHTVTLLADPAIFTIAADDKVDVIAAGVALPLWLSGGGL